MSLHEDDPRRAGNAKGAEVDAGQATNSHDGTSHATFTSGPPTVEQAEAAVLGAMIASPDALMGACRMLAAGGHLFSRPAHRTLFDLLEQMHLAGDPVDVITVTDRAATRGKLDELGGPLGVSDLSDPATCPVPATWRAYCEIVLREARRRRGIKVLRDALARLEAGEDPAVIAEDLAVAV